MSKPPIVLAHGLFGFDQVRLGKLKYRYFNQIDAALADAGYPLIIPQVHPTASIRNRAQQLKRQILSSNQFQRGQKLIVIAHSMGGLDARYMISRLGMAEHVAALLTLGTAHHGSSYADWCLINLGRRLHGLKLMNFLGLDMRAVRDLTTRHAARFNKLVPDHPQVKYFSITAERPWRKMPAVFLHSHKIIANAEGDNDGMVSVDSATWGMHLGTWEMDHFDLINFRLPRLFKRPRDVAPRYVAAVQHIVRILEDGKMTQINKIAQIRITGI